MPKETIFSPHPSDSESPEPFQMQVGWTRDMDVQVGISTADGEPLVNHLYADDVTTEAIGISLMAAIRQIGRNITDEDWDEDNPDHALMFDDRLLGQMALEAIAGSTTFGSSVWWHPGRQQINTLIRLLRKARDAAYGRDE